MKALPIRWQRLVDSEGKTCTRCAATQGEVEHAVAKLKEVLAPLNMSPQLEIAEVTNETFQANPPESNRIWIAGKPMEDWLGATVGKQPMLFRVRRRRLPYRPGPGYDIRSDPREAHPSSRACRSIGTPQ